MLHSIPPAVLTALTARIHEGVQQGRIDVPGLVNICAHGAQQSGAAELDLSSEPWTTQAIPWAQQLLSAVPAGVASLGISPHGAESAWPQGYPKQADGPRTAHIVPTAIIEAAWGLPDIVAIALALTINAYSGGSPPEVFVHPDLRDTACEARGKHRGRNILGWLAEMGLAARPWHLWIGPRAPIAVLSPYTRDLGEALWRWGQHSGAHPSDAPYDGGSAHPALYALADAFVADHPGLAQERAQAERSVGISQARVGGIEVAVVDVGRCAPSVWDTRLQQHNPWQEQDPRTAPLILQVPHAGLHHDERGLSALVARLSHSLGATAQSITVCQPGHVRADRGDHLQATSVLCTAGHWPLIAATPVQQSNAGSVDAVPWALHHVQPAADDVTTEAPPSFDDAPVTAAATVGGGGLLWARLLRLSHRGSLPATLPVQLHVYREEAPAALDSLALDFVRRILAPPQLQAQSPTPSAARKVRAVRV